MGEEKYQIVFKGDIAPGNDVNIVKKNLAALFRIGADKIEQFFSGQPMVLKKNLTFDAAANYQSRFEESGARCRVVKMTDTTPLADPTFLETRFRVVFSGETVFGLTQEKVLMSLCEMYKVGPDKLTHLFTGQKVTVQEPTDFVTAVKLVDRFKSCGAICTVEPVEPPPGEALGATKSGPRIYKVVFSGKITANQDHLSVKSRMASALGTTGVMTELLFSGKPLLLKGGLTEDDARLFKFNFEKTGAQCQLLEATAKPVSDYIPIDISKKVSRGIGKPTTTGTMYTPPPAGEAQQSSYNLSQPSDLGGFEFRDFTSGPSRKLISGGLVVVVFLAIWYFTTPSTKNGNPGKVPVGKQTERGARPQRDTPTESALPKDVALEKHKLDDYTDPQSFYTVKLPSGYKNKSRNFSGMKAIFFNYAETCSVLIGIKTNHPHWDPQLEMTLMVESIQGGRMDAFYGFSVNEYHLTRVNEMDGYEVLMSQGKRMAHLYVLDGRNTAYYYIAIITVGKNSEDNHDLLDQTIRDSFFPL